MGRGGEERERGLSLQERLGPTRGQDSPLLGGSGLSGRRRTEVGRSGGSRLWLPLRGSKEAATPSVEGRPRGGFLPSKQACRARPGTKGRPTWEGRNLRALLRVCLPRPQIVGGCLERQLKQVYYKRVFLKKKEKSIG